ncbi:uncharacterized protein [Clytia hemisphaerica]|uniref:uncharacterized protein isoform X2 n=1 Tax=Clytia hemisphaerica TaxID=252671 RepID=UPI0034D70A80
MSVVLCNGKEENKRRSYDNRLDELLEVFCGKLMYAIQPKPIILVFISRTLIIFYERYRKHTTIQRQYCIMIILTCCYALLLWKGRRRMSHFMIVWRSCTQMLSHFSSFISKEKVDDLKN